VIIRCDSFIIFVLASGVRITKNYKERFKEYNYQTFRL
jgi:hypothetical protein